ncbi:nucleoside diphosphate-linked moiety X motif 19-like [Lacerta agilis]|uniref:nucleoside diphosphate-linked moiety X motif 19-like n=1 Tax=Lacerta agilis TaxID=80427 RepID=UPI001419EF28|nr:nucleoside diphosphate-linked moiety X motif 19-like [Lacerta agilis]
MGWRLRHWREVATLLLVAGGPGASPSRPTAAAGAFDYELLLLWWSPRSAFLPSAHVFAGGVADAADFSSDWLQLLPGGPRCGLGSVQGECPRAPLFTAERPELGSPLPGDVAFRLCAIREAFEEAGVLLVLPGPVADAAAAATTAGPARLLPAERLPPSSELAEWRLRVQRQPGSFLQLCRHLSCVPNIWALREWSNWLTPVGHAGRGGRRYDTTFYLCCLGQAPPVASHDDREVTACQGIWATQDKGEFAKEDSTHFMQREFNEESESKCL